MSQGALSSGRLSPGRLATSAVCAFQRRCLTNTQYSATQRHKGLLRYFTSFLCLANTDGALPLEPRTPSVRRDEPKGMVHWTIRPWAARRPSTHLGDSKIAKQQPLDEFGSTRMHRGSFVRLAMRRQRASYQAQRSPKTTLTSWSATPLTTLTPKGRHVDLIFRRLRRTFACLRRCWIGQILARIHCKLHLPRFFSLRMGDG